MSGFTAHFHIPYPTIGEGITSAAMAAFATQVNATLSDIGNMQNQLLHRPVCVAEIFNTTSIGVANTDVPIGYDANTRQTRSSFHDEDLAPTLFVIPESGVYYVSVFTEVAGADPLRTQVKVKKNGTAQFSTLSADPLIIGASTQYTRGLVVCTGGDVITATALVTSGTPPWTVAAGRFMIAKLSDM